MPKSFKNDMLQRLVDTYTQRLGGRFAPGLRLIPGPECYYNPIRHRIYIGTDVIAHTDGPTWKAIIAHEVGHSLQPTLRRARWTTWGLIALCVLVTALPSLARLMDIEGISSNWALLAGALPWLPVIYEKLKGGRSAQEHLELEFDADAKSVALVGKEVACNALIEYSRVFSGGCLGVEGKLRLARMRGMELSMNQA